MELFSGVCRWPAVFVRWPNFFGRAAAAIWFVDNWAGTNAHWGDKRRRTKFRPPPVGGLPPWAFVGKVFENDFWDGFLERRRVVKISTVNRIVFWLSVIGGIGAVVVMCMSSYLLGTVGCG